MCTCPIGINGQPCKHQHFVASHFSLHLPNLAPIHSKSGRQLLAVVAVGKERIQSLEFYSSLHEQSLQESLDSSAVNPDDPDINETVISDPGPDESGTSNANPDESGMKDTGECDIKEFSINGSEYNDPDESGISLEQAINSVKTTLKDIFIDIESRLDPTNLDTSFFNGIVKFTERYQKLSKMEPATPQLASAFHNFDNKTGQLSNMLLPGFYELYISFHALKNSCMDTA